MARAGSIRALPGTSLVISAFSGDGDKRQGFSQKLSKCTVCLSLVTMKYGTVSFP